MSWERRQARGRYYTRTRRVNGRQVREYVGSGPAAEQAAALDAHARHQRTLEAARWRCIREEHTDIDRQLRALWRACSDAVAAELTAAGFHQHTRGEWRRRRAGHDDGESTATRGTWQQE